MLSEPSPDSRPAAVAVASVVEPYYGPVENYTVVGASGHAVSPTFARRVRTLHIRPVMVPDNDDASP